jgi:capsular exopolysaccharide synthesis family protein
MSDDDREVERTRPLDLREFLRILRVYWAGATIVILAATSAAAVWSMTQPRVFESSASGVVQAVSGSDAGLALAADNLAKSKAETYVRLAASEALADDVAASLDDGRSSAALLSRVSAVLADDSAIIEVTATDSSAEQAMALADAWIEALTARVELLENPEGTITTQAVTFVALATAPLPSSPASPNVRIALVLGALSGALLAVVYALARNQLDRRIRSAEVIERDFGVSVLGTLVEEASFAEQRGILPDPAGGAERHAAFAFLESLRELRTNLSYVAVDDPPRSLLVASGSPAEGKSTIAANLARSVASSGRRVVLIDCDLRKPVLAAMFGAEPTVGLTDVLSGRATVGDVIQRVRVGEDLFLLGSGATPPNPSELLGSRAMRDLVATLSDEALVIIDAPPLLPVTDGAILSTVVDGVIVVVNARKTNRDQLERALSSVRKVGGHVLGVVLNRVPQRGESARSYGYYGGAYYAADGDRPRPPAPAVLDPDGPDAERALPTAGGAAGGGGRVADGSEGAGHVPPSGGENDEPRSGHPAREHSDAVAPPRRDRRGDPSLPRR